MIKRIYIFIVVGTLIQNSYLLFEWLHVSQDWIYYTYYPACNKLEIALLPLWWVFARLFPFNDKENESWLYMIASTYFIFQLLDVYDMFSNENQRDSSIDFILYISLNLIYYVIFKKRN